MTLINTKGMAFFGPGSEWFWAALQFTALLITFVAIYRQLRITRSARAVEQVREYTTQYDSERMRRHRLAILVAVRDGMKIPDGAGTMVGDYFETLAWLSRFGHMDVKLLWEAHGHTARIWWTVLDPFIRTSRAEVGESTYTDWEWLVGRFVGLSRQRGDNVAFDQAWVADQLPGLINTNQEAIRVEEALRNVIIAPSGSLDTFQSVAAAPALAPTQTAENEREHKSD
ncbi:MAG: hypothetical protein WB793_13725 [Candidatus Dormiibacterota bacterium]